jgi:hypothetical protein
MLDIALGIAGILVSVLLFLMGYRQTVGAKKERIGACNQALEKILVRRIVLESHAPAPLDIERLIQGKARDYRVRPAELFSVGQTLNAVYTRITESDLIPAESRQTILDRILPALTESESKPDQELPSDSESRSVSTVKGITLLAVGASLIGALTPALPALIKLNLSDPNLLKVITLTAAASLGAITAMAFFYKIRASQEDVPTRAQEFQSDSRFESKVASSLQRIGLTAHRLHHVRYGDFIIEKNGRRYLLDLKNWPRRVPADVLRSLAERLKSSAQELSADEAIIVTRAPMLGTVDLLKTHGVRLLTEKQLIAYLADVERNSGAA